MKHPFIASLVNKSECALCHRDNDSHGAKALCESCDAIGDCEIFGKLDNPRAMLLCETCTQKEIDANTVVLAETQLSIIEKAQDIDSSIRYNGDFFNAETVSLAEIKQAVDDDITIENKSETFQKLVMERIEKYKTKIFELDDEKHKLVAFQQASIKTLRDFGTSLRAEIRERIKLADATYTPSPIVKQVKMPKAAKSPMERLIEAYMLMHSCSETDAKEAITKGKM